MGILKSLAKFFSSAFFLGLCVALLFTAVSFLFYTKIELSFAEKSFLFQTLQQLHEKSVDLRLRARGPRTGSDQIAILAVDERAVEQIGRWPWSRDKIAHVIDEVRRYQGKVIAFDMIFSEPDPNSAVHSLARLKDKVKSAGSGSSVLALIDDEISRSNPDEILAKSIEHFNQHLVMGSYFDEMEVPLAPFQQLCWESAYQKTPTAQNWAHEGTSVLVNDTATSELPSPWQTELDAHLHKIALATSQIWLTTNRQLLQPLRDWLGRSLGQALSDNQFYTIFVYWAQRDRDSLQELLSGPAKNSKLGEKLAGDLNSALKEVRGDLLALEIEAAQLKYCARFLSAQDELMNQWEQSWPQFQAKYSSLANLSFTQGLAQFKQNVLSESLHHVGRFWMDIPPLIQSSQNNAFFNAHLDSDAAVRRAYLLVRTGNQFATSLPLKAYLVGQGYNLLATIEKNLNLPGSKMVSELKVIDAEGEPVLRIPVDVRGRAMINYAGPRQMFAYVSMADLMSPSPDLTLSQRVRLAGSDRWTINERKVAKADFIKDKYFIAGATATGIYDLRVTPFEENYPGVETHANVLDNLLRRDFLRLNTDEEIYMPLFMLGLGVLLSLTLAHIGALAGFVLASASLLGLYFIDKYFLFNRGVVVNITLPLMLILVLYLLLTFYKYLTEERKKKELKGTFQKYVSPAIVNEILADPSNLELGGRKETITVFFSDVRGFTTISEKLDPKALSDLLNSYLTPMTRLVFEHKGTLDKYMGDAIMAFFGAPIHYRDHAHHACRCALAHLKKLGELQREYERKGLPNIDIGIGLNTGEMSVGNMGSDIVRNYTVMGDAVNLGSRLEGINKQYGTRIVISEFTQNEIKDHFTTREIDWVRVKGKAQPVKIFELVSEGEPEPAHLEQMNWFREGYQKYHQRKWREASQAFARALELRPQDGCSELYLQRCQSFLDEPPPENWDGVYVMKTK